MRAPSGRPACAAGDSAVLAAASAPGAQGSAIAIRGVTLIDGTGRAPVPGATVVIEGNRIKDVGTQCRRRPARA